MRKGGTPENRLQRGADVGRKRGIVPEKASYHRKKGIVLVAGQERKKT